MTREELARLALEVLDQQKQYFRTRSTLDLQDSKTLEAKLRKAASEILDGPSLFGDE
jgi:hypothetical protein